MTVREVLRRLTDEGWVQTSQKGSHRQFEPGSFGCHELLDRVMLLGDVVEGQILDHPACALQAEWHQLATQAVEALRELYQRIGAEHLAADEVGRAKSCS